MSLAVGDVLLAIAYNVCTRMHITVTSGVIYVDPMQKRIAAEEFVQAAAW